MIVRWDAYELDVPARRLRGPEGDVHVEPQVFDVLVHLVQNRERVVEKAELLDEVWGDQFVSESALTTRIKQVRRAVGDDGRKQRYVRNVHGRGYQFIGEIADRPTESAPLASQAPAHREPQVSLALSIALDDEYPFVGREEELADIESLLREPGPAQALIGGAPGLGKSRLAIYALERAAENGIVVCAGRCEEQVTSALQPIRDAISQIATAYPAEFGRWCSGVEGPLASLIPSLGLPVDPDAAPVDGYAGLDALLTVFDQVAQDHDVAILVDDLQWSDQPTRAFLSQVHRRSGTHAISTIATFRSSATDLRPAVRQWINEQSRLRDTTRLDIEQLDHESAAALARSVLSEKRSRGAEPGHTSEPDELVVQGLLSRTGGHALFLTESLRDVQLGLHASGSITDLVAARLDRLDANVKSLVSAGAVIGPEFTFGLAVEAAELDPPTALDAIDQAVEAELLHETDSASRFRFSHQLIPEAIRESMSRAAKAQIHYRCANALTAADGDEMEIAVHTLGAIPLAQTETALEVGVAAADHAMQINQFDRATRLLELCLEAETQTRQRGELLIRMGEAHVASGRALLGAPYFESAAQIARKNDWSDLLVAAALGHHGRSPYRRPADRSTLALLEEALEAVGEEDSIARARVLAKTAAFSAFGSTLAARGQMTLDALEMAKGSTGVDRMELLESRAIVFTCPAGVDELEKVDDELADLRSETDAYFADAAAPETARLMRGDGPGLRTAARVDEARSRVQPISEWRDLVLESTLAAFDGSFDVARATWDEAARIGEPYWGDSCYVMHAYAHVFVSALSGDWERSTELTGALHEMVDSILFQSAYAWSLAARGDLDRAANVVESIRPTSFRWLGEHIIGGNALIAAAETALLIGDDELLSVSSEHLEPFSGLVLGVPWACSLASADTLARVAQHRGDDALAAEYTTTARKLYTSLEAPALLARLD